MSNSFSLFALLLILALSSSSVSAHTGAHEINGFLSGLTHPFLGLDHLLVMLGVGLWASRLKRFHVGFIAVFLSFMLIGAELALLGFPLQNVETGILFSVLLTGFLLATIQALPNILVGALFACFAIFHGFAHGAEMPQAATPVNYALGFLLATTMLQTLGLVLGRLLTQHQWGLRIAGYLTSGLALYLFISA